MAAAPLHCTRCQYLVELPGDVSHQQTVCPKCGAELECWLLPALFRLQVAGPTALPAAAGQADCFNHPGRRAVVECEGCGRFLCGLCDLEVRGRHYCPACFDKKRTEGTLSLLPDRLTRYDRIALALALLPILFCCAPALFTVPITVFIAIKFWNAPGSERLSVRNTMVASIILGALEILFFFFWIWVAITA